MPTVAYLANLFPAASERYVAEEIRELRRRGITVIAFSVRRVDAEVDADLNPWISESVYLYPLRLGLILRAARLCLTKPCRLTKFLRRILFCGKESPGKRVRALAHTFLGAYFAAVLKKFQPQHIHVHHGYFGSWIVMVAAQLLGIDFSMTLHGSDLLQDPAYLDLKLELCRLGVTVSEFNRRYLLANYPHIDPRKIVVQRLGVDCSLGTESPVQKRDPDSFVIFTAGRLHEVKDHAFLIRACRVLKNHGLKFACLIAGDGPERRSLERGIRERGLENEAQLLGHISHEHMPAFYEMADLVVLTSRSEGIPLILMEAMAHEKLALAPNITGIPELVCDGKTGFLYRPGSLQDFVAQVEKIHEMRFRLDDVRKAARRCVLEDFNQQKNLAAFCDRLIATIAPYPAGSERLLAQEVSYENPVLQ